MPKTLLLADGSGTIPFPGVNSIENHMVVGGTLAVATEITRYFRARIGVSLAHEKQHFITYGDSGRTATLNGKLHPEAPRLTRVGQ